MATSYVQALLLLFVSIVFLPAALGTAIEFSNDQHHMYDGAINVTKVEIIPYPITFHDNPIFKITAVTSQSFDRSLPEKLLTIDFDTTSPGPGDGNIGLAHRRFYLCDVTKCPIEPGPLVITLGNIYDVQRPDHLSGEYTVRMFIYDNEAYPSSLHMYASFKFHASALPEFVNFPRLNGVSVRKVEIFPYKVTVKDNPVFRIFAHTPKNISSNSTVSARMTLEGSGLLIPKTSRRGYELCDSTFQYVCPVKAGPLVLTIPHPYWRHTLEAGRYRVEVHIVNRKPPFQESMSLVFWFSRDAVVGDGSGFYGGGMHYHEHHQFLHQQSHMHGGGGDGGGGAASGRTRT